MRLLGPYAIEDELGRGGTGIVFRGRAPDGTPVAIKLLTKRRDSDVARFAREARLQSSLGERDGFVPLLDAGDAPEGPYLVLPLLTGGSLRDRMKRGPLPIEQALELAIEIASAIEKAHEKGLVHRDLKPENVLFTKGGRPLVADLGLAKHFTFDRQSAGQSFALSKTGELRGTVGYMPPEQMTDSKTVGPEADVFALGAIVHEMVAGEPAFAADSPVELVRVVASGESSKLRRARREAPPRLEAIVARCLAPNPEDRFRDAGELREALEAGEPDARPIGPWLLGLGLVGAAAALGLWAVLHGRPPGPAPTSSPASAPASSPAPGASASPAPRRPVAALVASGKVHLDKNELEAALADFDRAIELEPANAEAWGERAAVRIEQKRWDDAIRDASRAIELEPSGARWWGNRGHARLEQGDLTRALVDLDRAVALDVQGTPEIALRHGEVLFMKGDVDGAIEDFSRAIRLDPRNAKAWGARAQAWRNKHDDDKTIADADRALELDPDLVMALGNRGQAWASKGNFEKGLADLARAVAVDPKNGTSWAALGVAHFNKGDMDAAIEDTTKAIEVDPTQDIAFAIRGLARERKGDHAGARQDLLKARELGSKEPLVEKTLARLAK